LREELSLLGEDLAERIELEDRILAALRDAAPPQPEIRALEPMSIAAQPVRP